MPAGAYVGRDPIADARELAPDARIFTNIPSDGSR
jgi:hypothetical protein